MKRRGKRKRRRLCQFNKRSKQYGSRSPFYDPSSELGGRTGMWKRWPYTFATISPFLVVRCYCARNHTIRYS